MKKKNAFLLSAIGLTLVAVVTLLIIFGIKGALQAFFTSPYGAWTIIGVVVWLLALAFFIIKDKVSNL